VALARRSRGCRVPSLLANQILFGEHVDSTEQLIEYAEVDLRGHVDRFKVEEKVYL